MSICERHFGRAGETSGKHDGRISDTVPGCRWTGDKKNHSDAGYRCSVRRQVSGFGRADSRTGQTKERLFRIEGHGCLLASKKTAIITLCLAHGLLQDLVWIYRENLRNG